MEFGLFTERKTGAVVPERGWEPQSEELWGTRIGSIKFGTVSRTGLSALVCGGLLVCYTVTIPGVLKRFNFKDLHYKWNHMDPHNTFFRGPFRTPSGFR